MAERDGTRPLVTVVVCTRDRPRDLDRCLRSVVRAATPGCRIVVVDQGADTQAQAVTHNVAMDGSDVELVRSGGVGLSLARNEGTRRAAGGVVIYTDDDCEVDVSWVHRWSDVFAADPTLGVGFGTVVAPAFDPAAGHVPTFAPEGTRSWGRELFLRGASAVGMGASMAVRWNAWRDVGGFDECLGAGARFPAAEEIDLAYRVAAAGFRVAHMTGADVLHHGFRDRNAASRLVQGYAAATGAMYAKHVRCHDGYAMRAMAADTWHLAARVGQGIVTGARPLGLSSLLAFLRSIPASASASVDRRRRLYIRASGDQAAADRRHEASRTMLGAPDSTAS